MKLKTMRVRRSNPSFPAFALALMLTMLCVYFVSLSVEPKPEADAAAARAQTSAELHMEGLTTAFRAESACTDRLEARVIAARCVQEDGAGLILADDGRFVVVSRALPPDEAGEDDLLRSAGGLTLKLQGSSGEVSAVTDAVHFLHTQAKETGALADALSSGDTDASSLSSLLRIYRTEGSRALEALRAIERSNAVARRLETAIQAALSRLDSAIDAPNVSKTKLIHAAACAEWISLLEEFGQNAAFLH